MHPPLLANLFQFDYMQWLFIAIVALLIFGGKRLPEVGRSLGRGITEFKKGLAGVGDDTQQVSKTDDSTASRPALPAGYKFDPYTGKPLSSESTPQGQLRFDPYTGKPLDPSAQSQSTSSNT
jgi:TatA/E family protein of Tat protein translocase